MLEHVAQTTGDAAAKAGYELGRRDGFRRGQLHAVSRIAFAAIVATLVYAGVKIAIVLVFGL